MIYKLIAALDNHQPRWYITLADQRDLQDFIEASHATLAQLTWPLERKIAQLEYQARKIKQRTAERLFIVVRAAVHAGLIIDIESLQGALGSEETGRALLEVARNAQELASIQQSK